MSTTLTVRMPRELAERMKRHSEINWNEVVRRSIEEYLDRLEETLDREPAAALVERLLSRGLEPGDLEPLPPSREKELAERTGEEEWRRVRYTTRAR